MRKIFRVGLALVFVACLSLNALPMIAEAGGTYSPVAYSFEYSEYGEYVDDFSYIEPKETTSSIRVENYSASRDYHVIAYGAYSAEQGSPLYDASGGNAVYFYAGGYQDRKLTNYVVEWGYCATAIRGIYQGDSVFSATGCFTPDY